MEIAETIISESALKINNFLYELNVGSFRDNFSHGCASLQLKLQKTRKMSKSQNGRPLQRRK